MTKDKTEKNGNSEERDLESLLREKDKIDSIIKRRYTKSITVLFTDITGSTQLAKDIGDIAMRGLIKRHLQVISTAVSEQSGILVKTLGDGTLSYFEDPSNAVKAAVKIQNEMAVLDASSKHKINIRCGMNTGNGIVEQDDIYGDVVNIAQRVESISTPLSILISDSTYEDIKDSNEFKISFLRETKVKGKLDPIKIYKVIWSNEDSELTSKTPIVDLESQQDRESTHKKDSQTNTDPTKSITSIAQIEIIREGSSPFIVNIFDKDLIIGRSTKADVKLPELFVSRQHAKIYKRDKTFFIEDLNSLSGTFFNGEKISSKILNDNDLITIGSITLIFRNKTSSRQEASQIDNTAYEQTLNISADKTFVLTVKSGTETVGSYDITQEPSFIGRHPECEIRLNSLLVSRKHASIKVDQDDKVVLEDLNSNNGTYIDGKKIEGSISLPSGSCFKIGHFEFQLMSLFDIGQFKVRPDKNDTDDRSPSTNLSPQKR